MAKSGVTRATKIDERWKSVVQSVGLPLEVGEAYLVARGLIPPDTRVKKPSAAQLLRLNVNDCPGTGAPTEEVDQSIMNESNRGISTTERRDAVNVPLIDGTLWIL